MKPVTIVGIILVVGIIIAAVAATAYHQFSSLNTTRTSSTSNVVSSSEPGLTNASNTYPTMTYNYTTTTQITCTGVSPPQGFQRANMTYSELQGLVNSTKPVGWTCDDQSENTIYIQIGYAPCIEGFGILPNDTLVNYYEGVDNPTETCA